MEINSEGYTVHKFTNHLTNPDLYELGPGSNKITAERSNNNFNQQLLRRTVIRAKKNERGKLLSTEVFNASKQVKKKVLNMSIIPIRLVC